MSQPIVIDLRNQEFTQSEFAMWDLCPYKWYLHYCKRLDLVGHYSWSLIIGSAWHEVMQNLYSSKGKDYSFTPLNKAFSVDVVMTSELEKEIEQKQEMVEAMAQAYAEFFSDDFKAWRIVDLEKTLAVELEVDGVPIILTGKRDIKGYLGTKGIACGDHKSSFMINKALTEGWDYNFQFMIYLWLDRKCSTAKDQSKHFLVNVVRKPQLRLGAGEHITTYGARVKMAMLAKPDEYFHRQLVDLEAEGIKRFEEEMLMPKLKRIALLQKNPELVPVLATMKNTNACNSYNTQCEFFAHCYRGENKQFKPRKQKHVELIGE